MRWIAAALICLSVGCYPDLSGYRIAQGDAGPPRPGFDAGPPRPGFDAGPTVPMTGGPCARPTLFVAAQSLGDEPSQVLRYELHGTGGVVRCGPATAEGELLPEPFALAAVSDRFVLVAARDGVDGVDPVEDRHLFHVSNAGQHPNDAFPIRDPVSGDALAAVAWSRTGSSASLRGNINQISAYSIDGEDRTGWDTASFMLGGTTSITASTRASDEAIAANSSNFSAAELDLFGGLRREPALLPPFMSTALYSVSAGRGGDGRERFVYTGLVDTEPSILIIRDPYTGYDDLGRTGLCEMELCDPVHAVPDPTVDDAVIAICRYDDGRTEIQRFDLGRSVCETFVGPGELGSLRPWYLAILDV